MYRFENIIGPNWIVSKLMTSSIENINSIGYFEFQTKKFICASHQKFDIFEMELNNFASGRKYIL